MPYSLHVIASINKLHGGPSYSVPRLCDALATLDYPVKLVAKKSRAEQIINLVLPRKQAVQLIMVEDCRWFGVTGTRNFKQVLLDIMQDNPASLIHNHGLWLECNRYSAMIAQKLGVPYIVSPRGMMEPWAFNHNAWKKKPVWYLWQKNALIGASAFCSTSLQEAENIRMLGFQQPIAVIPNGVDFLEYIEPECNAIRGENTALFLSRIHPKKGLLELVQAWALVRPDGWKVIIAGPDEKGHKSMVMKEIVALGLDNVFEFVGPVEGSQKSTLYREASLFILPTFSENFGIVVAEALAAGTPVITTKGTPWEGLVKHNCGWWIDIGVESLAAAIREAISLSDDARIAMGQRGREYVMSEFGWDEIGRKMVAFYDWILTGGTPPDFVRLD